MAKRPPPGHCVHCLGYFTELTWDHVFPLAWYPESTPRDLEKWKVPACRDCNQLHSKNEGDLMVRLGMCVDDEDPLTARIADKALRAARPSEGRNEKDARSREATRQRLLKDSIEGQAIPQDSVIPGFGPQVDQAPSDQVGLLVSQKSLHCLAEKIVRGLVFAIDRDLIRPPYKVDPLVLSAGQAAEIRRVLGRHGQVFERGPGIRITRAVAADDKRCGCYEIVILGRLTIHAFVENGERTARGGGLRINWTIASERAL